VAEPTQTNGLVSSLADLSPSDRLRVLAATTETFIAEGYAATTAQHLQAQIEPPVFDALFEGKEDCFLQTYDYLIAEARTAIAASVPTQDRWPKRLAAALSALLDLIDTHNASAQLVLVLAPSASPAAVMHHMKTIGRLTPFMEEGRALAEADAMIPHLVDSAYPGGVAFTLGRHLLHGEGRPAAEVHTELLRFLLLPYLGDRETEDFLAAQKSGNPDRR
jgi:AcrR family transcriptional regulator